MARKITVELDQQDEWALALVMGSGEPLLKPEDALLHALNLAARQIADSIERKATGCILGQPPF